jgi:hypothetical protein
LANDHYITRFLTDPWEFGQRRLHYFDFETGEFDDDSSKNVYAQDGLNSPTVEAWLNKVIETPLSNARPRLQAGDPSALDDPKFFRAAVLMLMLQGLRTGTAVEGAGSEAERLSTRTLAGLAAMSSADIEGLVAVIGQTYSLYLLFTPTRAGKWTPLAMPSTGIFPVTFPDRGCLSGWATGVSLPIDPRCALVAAPAGDQSQLDLGVAAQTLAHRSLGPAACTRVVLHPALIASMPGDELRRELLEMRRSNDEALTLLQQTRSTSVRLVEQFGFRVKEHPLSGRMSIASPADPAVKKAP